MCGHAHDRERVHERARNARRNAQTRARTQLDSSKGDAACTLSKIARAYLRTHIPTRSPLSPRQDAAVRINEARLHILIDMMGHTR